MNVEFGFAVHLSELPKSFDCASVFVDGDHGWCKYFAKRCWKDPDGKGLPVSGSVGCCRSAHDSQRLERSGEVWARGGLFFFLIEKEPFVLTEAVECRPGVTAETLKACALIGFAHDR